MADDKMRASVKRWLLRGLAALYVATWVWGIPATHTDIAAHVVRAYKTVREKHPGDVRGVHPRLDFGASYAILPLVIVNHYEYHAAALWGWGGFTVDIWYFSGRRTVFALTKWIS